MSMQRNIYLKMKTLREAREILFTGFALSGILPDEFVPAPDAVGRVLAEPVSANLSSPHFHAAAMDGIAVRAETTFGAAETRPQVLIAGEDAFYVNTGQVMPAGTDAVIMIEHVNETGENRLEIEAPAVPWQHVRKMGEDIVATELLFPRHHVVTPYCVGALLAGGVFTVPVQKRPVIRSIPTGSELFDWQKHPVEEIKPGQVLETNSYILAKLAESWGGDHQTTDIFPDDPEVLEKAVTDAVADDVQAILIIGGSSAGSEDHARRVIAQLGEVLVHGVTIMPGKPIIIGKIREKPVFGMPGYPVSAIMAFEQFVGPLIRIMLGQSEEAAETVDVEPTRKIASRLGVEEFVRVKLGAVGDRIVATTLPRGAGLITSITEADGIIRIPNELEGVSDNQPVRAKLLNPLSSIRNTIVVVGSHDNTLDVLADEIKASCGRLTLSSSHVGSMGGLMAIKMGGCHVAGAHLLDPEDGSYNMSYVKRYLRDVPVKLVNLVLREQGLIVRRGNPKQIKGIEDLARPDISFINRQAGSGTRILLDYRLRRLGLDADDITGYTHEEFTHMAVAVAVLSGSVDVGLGIHAAARALNLDFIPVVTEQYDLIIPQVYFESENIAILLDIINSDRFKNRVEALGGYGTERTGDIVQKAKR